MSPPREEAPTRYHLSDSGTDVAHVLATMFKNSVTIWLTLEPREIGVQTLQVFVKDSEGHVVEGKTMPVTVIRNIEYLLKRITSGTSILTGAMTPALNMVLGA